VQPPRNCNNKVRVPILLEKNIKDPVPWIFKYQSAHPLYEPERFMRETFEMDFFLAIFVNFFGQFRFLKENETYFQSVKVLVKEYVQDFFISAKSLFFAKVYYYLNFVVSFD
jgi:hypothetical protein